MAIIDDLIQQIEDDSLRKRIVDEIHRIQKRRKFGIMFEEHLPECTPLFNLPILPGTTIAKKKGEIKEIYNVRSVVENTVDCINRTDSTHHTFKLNEVVRVAEFGEPIYPHLILKDTVKRSPDTNIWNLLIESENYHALQLLGYLYEGKVDCIYIDPPFNTGATKWKYNNNIVDENDLYRHSKWLSMIKKRLVIAKKLLNPKNSALIIAIDENESNHLGCLLEDLFPEASSIQMITAAISAKGVVQTGRFSRVEEYVYFVLFGEATIAQKNINMLSDDVKKESQREIDWIGLRRREPSSKRQSRPHQFYPIFVNEITGMIHSIGDDIPPEIDRGTIIPPENCIAIWPLNKDGDERLWGLTPDILRNNWTKGYVKVKWDSKKKQGTVYYLPKGTIDDIESGIAKIDGHMPDGSVIAYYTEEGTIPPKKMWNLKSHNAETYGTKIVSNLLPGRTFPYPKSIYYVKDCIEFVTKNKKDAIIVDFFAGSGTTLHSVNLLNKEDGGHRRCIMITNNEVSPEEEEMLTNKGLNPGDAEWDARGIANYITWPRTVCSINGSDINGNQLSGDYLNGYSLSEGFESNCAFFKLGFLDKDSISLGKQLGELLPLLWIKSGAFGDLPKSTEYRLPGMSIMPENKFAILLDESQYSVFCKELEEFDSIQTIFIVTNSDSGYKDMVTRFKHLNTFQLYRDYIDNFKINTSRR